jgi:acyl-CoA synthetase (AMP-forming)/AMP-acid ligase II
VKAARPAEPLASRVRHALATAVSGARVLHRTGLWREVSPVAGLRFALRTLGKKNPLRILELHALNDPGRPAVVSGDVRLSYGELAGRVNRLAHGLHRLGVGPKDRVAVLLHNGHQHLELGAALGHLGGVAVQVGYRLKPKEVAYILANAGVRALVFHAAHAAAVEEALAEGGGPSRDACLAVDGPAPEEGGALPRAPGFPSYEELLALGDPAAAPRVTGGGEGGLMIYTSGTTGRAKGADRNFGETGLEPVLSFIERIPLRCDDRHLVTCPLYHSAASAFSALLLSVGGCLVILDHFEPRAVLRTMERERITSAMMVPTMLSRLVGVGVAEIRRHDLTSLRWLMSAAAPLPTELARRVEEAFGPLLYNFYGATETGFVTLAGPGEHTARPGTIGRLLGGVEARLLDGEGRPVPEGAVGELYVKSPMLVGGYHRNEDATRAAQRDGFFSVGDLARQDADGYFYLADRKHDLVISGGVNIYPFEIEQRLHAHPSVAEAAVVGAPDPDWGESLVAFVVLRDGAAATAEEIQRFVAAELADYKRPRRVLFVDALPRNPTGKVLKRDLKARLAADPAAAG